MPSLPDTPASPIEVRLPANCTTVAADDLRNSLVFAVDFGAGTIVDASDVQNVGQAVIQLLVAARRAALAVGKPYGITGSSDAFRARVHDCCLADAVGLTGEKVIAA